MVPYAGARQQRSPQHGKQSIPQARPELRAKPRKHHVQRTRTGRVHGLQSALYLFYSHKCGSNSDCDRRTRVAQQARIAHTRGRGAARDPGQNACTAMHTGERDGERRASEGVPGHLFVGPVIVDLQRAVAPPHMYRHAGARRCEKGREGARRGEGRFQKMLEGGRLQSRSQSHVISECRSCNSCIRLVRCECEW